MESLVKPAAGKRRKVHKDETAPEPIEVHLGDNGDLSDEDILMWVGKINQETAKKKAAAKRFGATWKMAINAGIVREDLEELMKQAEMDPAKVAAKYARKARYAKVLDIPIGQTLKLFDFQVSSIPKASELADAAYRKGFALGLAGLNPDQQAYPVGHELHQDHMRGWGAGQKVLLDKIKPIDKQLDEVEAKILRTAQEVKPEDPAAQQPEPAEA